jgi:hypothetical protein
MNENQDLQPALDAAQNQLGLTFSASDSLDTKALAILAYDVAIGIFVLQSELTKTLWLLVPLLTLLGMSLLVSLITVIPRYYVGAIVDLDEHQEYFELTAKELVIQLLADTEEAIGRNEKLNTRKTRYCLTSILMSLAATLLVVGCIINI